MISFNENLKTPYGDMTIYFNHLAGEGPVRFHASTVRDKKSLTFVLHRQNVNAWKITNLPENDPLTLEMEPKLSFILSRRFEKK